MSEALRALRDLWSFVADHPFVAAACLAGFGGLLLGLGAGRRER